MNRLFFAFRMMMFKRRKKVYVTTYIPKEVARELIQIGADYARTMGVGPNEKDIEKLFRQRTGAGIRESRLWLRGVL